MEEIKDKPVILSVAVPSPLRRTLDYLPPVGEKYNWQPGQRLQVPLGSRQVVGVLQAIKTESDFALDKLKPIIGACDEQALFSAELLQLYQWAADYYRHPIGAAFADMLPTALRKGQARIDLEEMAPWQASVVNSALTLTDEQDVAVRAIQQAQGFSPFLLYGVTGSGKTEVYFRSMQAVLEQGKQVLFLVPEIALTPQTLSRLEASFSVPVLAYHSGLTPKKRLLAWQHAQQGTAAIVIGTRSAVFLPLKNPGMIVVDEEHDGSYKQHSGFRYNARDCAVRRAQLEALPIILGSATPSLRSYNNALKKRYALLTLSRPAVTKTLAKRRCLQLSSSHYQQGISDELKQVMLQHLSQAKQVMLFLNRRGFAPLYLCPSCQHVAQCDRCDANFTFHQQRNALVCHHCDRKQTAMKTCPACERAEMIPYGLGTEQLEQAAAEMFPDKKIIRIDRDTTAPVGELKKQLQSIAEGEADIIIGTQMLAKGHHFPKLACVVVVNADQGFLSSDFRSAEQTAALLEQVAGRAGRELESGEVILQTLQPDNPYLQKLLQEGYLPLAEQLLQERAEAGLPPITAMALIAVESKQEKEAERFLLTLRQVFASQRWEWMGPMPALLAKRADWYRFQLGLIAPTPRLLQQQLQTVIAYLEQQKNRRVRWFVDVDPYTLM